MGFGKRCQLRGTETYATPLQECTRRRDGPTLLCEGGGQNCVCSFLDQVANMSLSMSGKRMLVPTSWCNLEAGYRSTSTMFTLRHLGEVCERVVVGLSHGWHTAFFGKSADLCGSVAYGHCWLLPESVLPGLVADSVCVTMMWGSCSQFVVPKLVSSEHVWTAHGASAHSVSWLAILWLRRFRGCGEVQSGVFKCRSTPRKVLRVSAF